MLVIDQVLKLSFLAGLLGVDATAALQSLVSRPLVAGGLAGWVLGDVGTGLATGSLVELLWMGGVPVGSLVPPDGTRASIFAASAAVLMPQWIPGTDPLAAASLGLLAAVPVGFAIGWYQGVRRFLDPLINFFRALPPIALIPLVIVYFGIGETAKVAILFYASFFAGVIVMVEGIGQISPIYVKVSRTLGANDAEIFAKVIVPLAVPHILTAVRVALGVAWATLVASELIAAQQGLGALIQNASSFFQLDIIYVGIVCIGLIALAMDLLLRAATRRLVAWQDRIA